MAFVVSVGYTCVYANVMEGVRLREETLYILLALLS